MLGSDQGSSSLRLDTANDIRRIRKVISYMKLNFKDNCEMPLEQARFGKQKNALKQHFLKPLFV